MTEEQMQPDSQGAVAGQQNPVTTGKKKKASWLRTILWMISMMLLVNAIMAIIAYFLFFYKK